MISFVFFLIHSFSLGLYNFIPSTPAAPPLESPQPLPPHTSFGDCKCDVSNKCDPYCCCDPDCEGASFDGYCLNQIEDLTSIKPSLRLCSDPEPAENGKLIDWFLRSSLCIYRSNNPSPGDFYTTNGFVESQFEQTRFYQLFYQTEKPSSNQEPGNKTSSPTPRGYDLFEKICYENNQPINFARLCNSATDFPLLFGASTSYECEVEPQCAVNGSFNLSDFATHFPTQYYASPFNNSIDGNVQNITSKYIQQDLNCTTEHANRTLDHIVQSIIVFYKSVGQKSSPQHIISDIQIRYQATLTDIQFIKLEEFNAEPSRKPKLRIHVHFYEEPNNLNSFKEPSKSDLYNWLPF